MRLFAIICCLTFFVVPIYAQEEVINLNSDELGTHQRPSVSFTHEKHAENIGCNACHHDYDVYGFNTSEDEGQRCAECHTAAAQTNPVPLMRAFHLQCKSCHQNMAAKGEASGPLLCGQCHDRESE